MFCKNCANQVSELAIACPKCGVPPLIGKNFCNGCAAETNPQAVICVKCGISLKANSLNLPALGNNSSVNEAIRQPVFWAAMVMLIAFFMPWLDIVIIKISGWQLRDLVRFVQNFQDESFKPSSLVNLMYFLPIFSILILVSFFSEKEFFKKGIRGWKIISGILPFLFLCLILSSDKSGISLGYGFYLTFVCGVYLFYDAFFISNKNKVVSPPVYSAQPIPTTTAVPIKVETVQELPRIDEVSNTTVNTDEEYDRLFTKPAKGKMYKRLAIGIFLVAFILALGSYFYNKESSSTSEAETVTKDTVSSSVAPPPYVNYQTPPPTVPDSTGRVMSVPAAEADIETKNTTNSEPILAVDENYYTVTAEKSYLFNDADPSTQRKGYIIKNDIVNVIKIKGDFAYVAYTNKELKSWVLLNTLEKGQNVE